MMALPPVAADSAAALIRAAREARGWSQAELGRRIGAPQQTIDKIEKGTIRHSRLFPRLALELALPLDRFIPEAAHAAAQPIASAALVGETKDLPVHAAAQGGPGQMIVSTDPVDWVLRPDPLRNVAAGYGVMIIGESMVPEFRPGDIALVNPHLPPMREETFVFYGGADGETKSTIKHLLRWTDAAWHVNQWNPPKGDRPEFTLPRREWTRIHRVVGKYSR
jgi:transcriptional regulator with XRE-family HTH domain